MTPEVANAILSVAMLAGGVVGIVFAIAQVGR